MRKQCYNVTNFKIQNTKWQKRTMLLKIEMQTRWNDTDSKSKKEALKYILKIHNERKSCDIKREEKRGHKNV